MKKIVFLLAAICWLIISTVLLCLPGSAFPKDDWLSRIWLDKWIHIFLFAVLVYLWCRAASNLLRTEGFKTYIFIGIAGLIFGVTMEFVQEYLVVNRSFDIGDILADAVGCFAGIIWGRYIKK